MELPYWQDLLIDADILWRTALAFGFGCLLGVCILYTVDTLGWPRWLADKKKGE